MVQEILDFLVVFVIGNSIKLQTMVLEGNISLVSSKRNEKHFLSHFGQVNLNMLVTIVIMLGA
jgi:hypothetical protein